MVLERRVPDQRSLIFERGHSFMLDFTTAPEDANTVGIRDLSCSVRTAVTNAGSPGKTPIRFQPAEQVPNRRRESPLLPPGRRKRRQNRVPSNIHLENKQKARGPNRHFGSPALRLNKRGLLRPAAGIDFVRFGKVHGSRAARQFDRRRV